MRCEHCAMHIVMDTMVEKGSAEGFNGNISCIFSHGNVFEIVAFIENAYGDSMMKRNEDS